MKAFVIGGAITLAAAGVALALEKGDTITRTVAGAEARDIYGGDTRVRIELVWKDEKKRENAHATVSVSTSEISGGRKNLIVSSMSIEDLAKVRDAFARAVQAAEAE